MSNGDDEPAEAAEEPAAEPATLADSLDAVAAALDAEPVDEGALADALDAAESAVAVADTEADLDGVESALDEIESSLEAADLPEPEDEEEEAPREALESRLGDLRDAVAEARGPYAADVIDSVEDSAATIADTRWTEQGEGETADAVGAFVASVNEALDASIGAPESVDGIDGTLDAAVDEIDDAGLDADDDAETIAALTDAAGALADGVEAAQAWSDLSVREQLQAEGFFDVLDHHKDFPPEWSAHAPDLRA